MTALLGPAGLPGQGLNRTIEYLNCRKTERGCDGDISVNINGQFVSDSRSSPTYRIFPGRVIVWDAVNSMWINPVAGTFYTTQASVTATLDVSVGGQVYTLTDRLGRILASVTTGGGDITNADVAIALNSDGAFAAYAVAAVVGGKLRITAGVLVGLGAAGIFSVTGTGPDAIGILPAFVQGVDADYRVYVDAPTDLVLDGSNISKGPRVAALGDFFTARLLGLTVEARQVLTDRGSLFYAG